MLGKACILLCAAILFCCIYNSEAIGIHQTVCIGAGLNLRNTPCGAVIKETTGSEKGFIVAGPKFVVCTGTNYTWWEIREFGSAATYWAAETNDLIKDCTISVCFQAGLNLRASPCGASVTISQGGETADIVPTAPVNAVCSGANYTWWEVTVTKGAAKGKKVWVAEETGLVGTSCGHANGCPKGDSPRDPAFERAVPCNGPSGLGCCCNEYVMGMFGDFTLGTSSDMFHTLPAKGWCKCSNCMVNAVASNEEHVAFVYNCGANDYLDLYGANQSCQEIGGCFNECACDNVSILRGSQWSGARISKFYYYHPTCC